jgi:hypothetical protein
MTFRVNLAAAFAVRVPGANAAGGRTQSADGKLAQERTGSFHLAPPSVRVVR